jgi:hypothetical protein
MKNKIKLSGEVKKFLEAHAMKLTTEDGIFYYIPYWIGTKDGFEFNFYSFGPDIPISVRQYVEKYFNQEN